MAEVAAEARGKGIEIYAVGVARADMASLRAMASPPFEDHVFLVESFDLIHQFGLQFQDKLCGSPRPTRPPPSSLGTSGPSVTSVSSRPPQVWTYVWSQNTAASRCVRARRAPSAACVCRDSP